MAKPEYIEMDMLAPAKINLGLLGSDQHQVFGKFDGPVVLDDGTRFEVAGLHGSAEVVHNRY